MNQYLFKKFYINQKQYFLFFYNLDQFISNYI